MPRPAFHPLRRACLPMLACIALPFPACGEGLAPPPALAPSVPSFDLGRVTARSPDVAARPSLWRQDSGDEEDRETARKIKLRLTYQPDGQGPRFQIGTVGSRKGAMKTRLLHIAMDWTF